ncbi:MAG TPA: sulfite exporter TauE/SafE family protein [Ignavibacteriaceae bacterium]|nr:sulfite exporter TauE/SafE family protein [Ignavibacteriaceae bacterium]
MLYLIISVIILAASFLFSMLGLGGALVYVPVLKWAGFPVKEVAIPLALLLNGFTTLIALIAYFKNKLVDVKGGLAMTISAFVFAPVGAVVSDKLPVNILLILFSAAVLVAAGRMLLMSRRPEPKEIMSFKKRAIIGALIGGFAGFMAGLLGIGGGFIMAPLLMWMGYETKKAAATSAFAVTFSSFSGFFGHVAQGHFNWTLTVILTLAVVIGALLGSNFMATKAKSNRVKQIFAIVLFAIAIKIIVGVI